MSKSTTAVALHVSEVVLLVFGVVLVVGLIGEYVERGKRWLKLFEMLVEHISKIPPQSNPEASEIEEGTIGGE